MIKGSCHSMDKSLPNVSHHPTKFCSCKYCGSGDIMILVCHVILEDHVIKVLKSAITIFSKAHGMSHSHIRNLTIKVALTKTFVCVSIDSTLILITPSCITNDEIYTKKNFCRSIQHEAKREKKKAIVKLFALHVNANISFRNKQYSPYYVKVPQKRISWTSIKNKMPNYTIFFLIPDMVETATESLSRLVICLFI